MTTKPKLWNHFYWNVLLLGSLIFSHPLFKAVGAQPEFLLAHNLAGPKLLLWVIVVGFLPGLVLVLLAYSLIKVFPPFRESLKKSLLFTLFSLFVFIHINDSLGSNLIIAVAVSGLLASAAVLLYVRSLFLRTFLSVATFLVVITPLTFSFSTEIRQILLPEQLDYDFPAAKKIDKQPVVILLFDELPLLSLLDNEGKINAQRYPNFADFAKHSTWYKYATGVAEGTLNAVPPILTGKLVDPSKRGLPLAANYPENIFTLLSSSHEINAYETFTHICPEDLCKSARPDWRMVVEDTLVVFAHTTTPDNFKQNLPQIDNKWVGYLRDTDVTQNLHTDREMHPHHRYKVRLEKFDQFMFELEGISAVSVNYLHILMPHSPWMYLPDGRVYSQAELRSFTGTLPSGSPGAKQISQLYSQPHLVQFANQRHLLQVGYVDNLLGRVITLLHERELFDDALIVIMADHGASFRPGESLRRANQASYHDILAVPLFIKYPGQQDAEINLRAARGVDVLPTILDALNSEFVNSDFDGQSLLKAPLADHVTLELHRDTGEILKYQFTEFKNRFDEAVKSRISEFSTGSFERIYALNDQGLLNQEVRQLPIGEPVDYHLSLDNPHLYKDIDLDQISIPSLIRARLSSQSDKPVRETVAVAVNGIVRAVSVLQQIDTVVFDYQVLVTPESFQNGANDIHFYQLNKVDGANSLSPIPFDSGNNADLISTAGTPLTLDFNGAELPISSTGAHGQMTIIADLKTNKLRLTGWSANSENGMVAEEIFIFSANKLIASVNPHSRYPDALETTGYARAEYSGFNLIVPIPEQKYSGPESLTAIAVFGSDSDFVAGELRYINYATRLVKTRELKLNRDVLKQLSEKNAVEPGRVYDFSDDADAQVFSGVGWSNASSSGARWNAAEKASLVFITANNQQSLELIMNTSPFFVKGKHETQVIKAGLPSSGEQQIHLKQGETDGKFSIHIAAHDIDPDGKVVIVLKFPNAASPKSLDVNADPRMLAIKVKTLQILIAAPEPD